MTLKGENDEAPEMEIVGIAPDGDSTLSRADYTGCGDARRGAAADERPRDAARDSETAAPIALTNVINVYNDLQPATGHQIGPNGYAS